MDTLIDSVRANTFKTHINASEVFCPTRYGLLRLWQFWPEVYAWSPHHWDRIDPRSQVSWKISFLQCAISKDQHDAARLLRAVIPSIGISFDNYQLTFVASDHPHAVETLDKLRKLPLWQ